MLVDIPGEQVGSVYLIEYSEDLWLSLDTESQQYCKDVWRRKAAPIPGCKFITIRLIPDPLFPIHGHEAPYVAWQEAIERPPEQGFTVRVVATVVTTDTTKYLSPVKRMAISKALEGVAEPGAHWQIVNADGLVLEHGRL